MVIKIYELVLLEYGMYYDLRIDKVDKVIFGGILMLNRLYWINFLVICKYIDDSLRVKDNKGIFIEIRWSWF